jgi:hypothetical protein
MCALDVVIDDCLLMENRKWVVEKKRKAHFLDEIFDRNFHPLKEIHRWASRTEKRV